MMAFHLIELEKWSRRPWFEHYTQDVPCTYSLTAEVDVTELLSQARAKGMRPYGVLIYGIASVANRHREFQMGMTVDGRPGWFDQVDPSYTVFHPEEECFSVLWTEYDPDIRTFYRRWEEDQIRYGGVLHFEGKPGAGKNCINISSLPWTSFTGFQLNLQDTAYLLPIFTMGRWQEREGRTWMPLAIQVHHGVCDGFHVGRFLEEFQQWANNALEN